MTTIGRWFQLSEGSKHVTKDGIREFERSGSWYDGVIGALATLKITCNAIKTFDGAKKWAPQVKKSKPAVLSIGWYQQDLNGDWQRPSGHWVVAVNVHNNRIICLDPDLDTGLNELAVDDVTNDAKYKVNYGGVQMTGWIDGIILP